MIEKTLDMRTSIIFQDSPAIHALGTHDLPKSIRAIVWEERCKLLPSMQPHVLSITNIVREEVQRSLKTFKPPQPTLQAMSYSAALRCNATPRPHQGSEPPQFRSHHHLAAISTLRGRPTFVWGATANHPLCYYAVKSGTPTTAYNDYINSMYRPYRLCQMGQRGLAIEIPAPQ